MPGRRYEQGLNGMDWSLLVFVFCQGDDAAYSFIGIVKATIA